MKKRFVHALWNSNGFSFSRSLLNRQMAHKTEAEMTNGDEIRPLRKRFPSCVAARRSLRLRFHHPLKGRVAALVFGLAVAATSLPAQQPPSASDILASVRAAETRQQIDLEASCVKTTS